MADEITPEGVGRNAAELAAGFNSSNDFEFIEIMNIGASAIDLSGCRFTNGIAFGRHFDEELGHMRQQTDRKLLQATVGAEGYFDFLGRSWNYEAYYSYGRSRQRRKFPTVHGCHQLRRF